jgi:site-specific recombinase XerC
MKHPDYPGVSSYEDRHGKTRWRFRKSGLQPVNLPGEPHSPDFDAAYEKAIYGQPQPRQGQLVRLNTAALPESLRAAYVLLRRTAGWQKLADTTRATNSRHIENFLTHGGRPIGDQPVADLRRKHIKAYLETMAETPHAAKVALKAIRKLTNVALDEEWIDTDPTSTLKYNPPRDGWPAWTEDMMDAFERRWPIGTPPRTAYALGLWLGNRASDVARLRWDQLKAKTFVVDGEAVRIEGFEFVQHKGRNNYGREMFLPLTPMLASALAPLDRSSERVLVSRLGRTFSDNALATAMIKWAGQAGVPSGYSMHGLRKALGVKLAEADATTREIMEVLGHTSIEHAALYTKDADKMRLAVKGMRKMAAMEQLLRKPDLKVVK